LVIISIEDTLRIKPSHSGNYGKYFNRLSFNTTVIILNSL